MRTSAITENNLKVQNRKSDLAAFMQYSILFCILVLGIYAVLIINHKSFIQSGDGVKQGYFWTVEFKHQIDALLEGKGLQLWSWSRILGMSVQTYRYWDPFNWIAAAFPVSYIELGYTIATLLRMYFGGVVFLALMRYSGLGVFSSVFGSALYTFSGYAIVTGLVHAEFLINAYLFPLLVLSVEMIYKKKTPVFFSIIVALYLISNFYHAYMAAISIIIYILIRYFAYNDFSLKDYAKTVGTFMLYGIIGMLIGSFQFVPDLIAMSGASTDSITDAFGFLFDKSYYTGIGKILVGTGNTQNYEVIGWSIISIILLAVAVPRIKLKNSPIVMTLLLTAAVMIPAACSVYNAFGYPSLRWIFALVLFASWTVAKVIDEETMLTKVGVFISFIALVLSAFLTLGLNAMFDLGLGKRSITFMTIQLIGGALFAALLFFARKDGSLRRLSNIMILVIFTGTMSAAWAVSFMDSTAAFYRNNRVHKLLKQSTQRAAALIDDSDFYRVDQVDSVSYSHKVKLPPNETLWWQTKSIYGYNSRIPSDLLEFNRLVGNNYGYFKRVAVNSNDNRTGLDYLQGVKYFLGDDLKNGTDGSDEYAGYGFEAYDSLDGVNVYKTKYDVSLGYVFDKCMSRSEFEKLGYAEREQALLQAVVLPDGVEIPSLSKVSASDIQTAAKDVKYTVVENNGASLNEKTIQVDKAGGSITLAPETVERSQLLVSITGLLRNVDEGQSQPFELHVKNEYVDEMADNSLSAQTIPNIKDYNLNMGYYDHYSNGKISVYFSSPGLYRYDDIKLQAMDAALFDSCIGSLGERKFNISSFSDSVVEGSADTKNGGILFLSIIEPDKWKCYIDGEEADIIKNTDIAFMGIKVPAGRHNITLKFHNGAFTIGLILSAAGAVLLTITCLIRRKRAF